MNVSRRGFVGCALGSIVLGGCARRRNDKPTPPIGFQEDEAEMIINVAVDLSGSFEEMMVTNGMAYQFLIELIDRYYIGRIGSKDRLILSQISGSDKPLLWEGSPFQLRLDYPTPDKFREFLLSKSDRNSSRVYESIGKSLNYMLRQPVVAHGRAQCGLFVLSDLVDSSTNKVAGEELVMKSLKRFAKVGGIFAFYFVDQGEMPKWMDRFEAAGFHDVILMGYVNGHPPFPEFS